MRTIRPVVVCLTTTTVALLVCAPSEASFPGANGRLAFVRNERIWSIEPDGTGIDGLHRGSDPRWSPDGTRIVFSAASDPGKTNIFTMDADGSDVVQVTSLGNFNLRPGWAPDGSMIVFRHNRLEADDLFTVRPNGSGLHSLTHTPGVVEDSPQWSPDGATIVFSRRSASRPFETEEIYRIGADGTGLSRLTANGVRDFQPNWSPDGATIAFVRQTARRGEDLFVMDADGSNLLRLTHNLKPEFQPAFSPDGTMLAFTRCNEETFTCDLFVMSLADGTVTRLTDTAALESQPDWQPLP